MDREKVNDERMLHASESVHLRLDDNDGSLLENSGFAQHLHLAWGGIYKRVYHI